MSILRLGGRLISALVTTAAKVLGAMSGAQTFGQDNATSMYKRNDDYRP